MAAYVLTDSAVIEALRDASARGVKVRVWRDASEAARLSEFEVEAQLGGRVQGLEIRSNAPGGELMHLKGYCDVPEYGNARAGAARFFGAEDALEAGQKAVMSKMNSRQIRAGLDKMAPVEKKLFQDGFVDQYVKVVRESGDRRNILNSIASSPAARERIMMALGPQRAKELESFLHVEGMRVATTPAKTLEGLIAKLLMLAGGYTGDDLDGSDDGILASVVLDAQALTNSRIEEART